MLYLQSDDLPIVPIEDVAKNGKGAFEALKGLSFDDAITKIANSLVDFSFKLLIAIMVLYVGKFIIKKLYRAVRKMMINRKVDPSLTTFILSLIKMILYFILIITIIGILGIETSSFLALFASAGVAIGMALSGTLQNFAGGVLILLLKPYKVGDFIETQGYSGTVKAIQIFHTIINTPDNKAVVIPNGGLSTGSINNYSLEKYRRVDWTIGLCYGCDCDKAKEKIVEILLSDDRVVKTTIEDDIAMRLSAVKDENSECDENGNNSDNQECEETAEKKPNFWKRFLLRRKIKNDKVRESLDKMADDNALHLLKASSAPFVAISTLADSSVNFTIRAWTRSETYWPLYFTMNERFYKELPAAGFDFPFPQLDVHLPK